MATHCNPNCSSSSSRKYKYTKVLDNRKHAIRGLWRRNGSFVARITVEVDAGRKAVNGCSWTPRPPLRPNRNSTNRVWSEARTGCGISGAALK
jgi:hypothetical protein